MYRQQIPTPTQPTPTPAPWLRPPHPSLQAQGRLVAAALVGPWARLEAAILWMGGIESLHAHWRLASCIHTSSSHALEASCIHSSSSTALESGLVPSYQQQQCTRGYLHASTAAAVVHWCLASCNHGCSSTAPQNSLTHVAKNAPEYGGSVFRSCNDCLLFFMTAETINLAAETAHFTLAIVLHIFNSNKHLRWKDAAGRSIHVLS